MLVTLISTIGLSFAVGCATGLCLRPRRVVLSQAKPAPDTPTPSLPEVLLPASVLDAEHTRELLDALHELTGSIDTNVNQHSDRVSAISNDLRARKGNEASRVLSLTVELLTANQQLQTDLSHARKKIGLKQQQLDAYMAEALTDPLTGIANRRALDQELNRRFAQKERDGKPFSLLFVDLDKFKSLNDSHGHELGDTVLREVIRAMARTLRDTDFLATDFPQIWFSFSLNFHGATSQRP